MAAVIQKIVVMNMNATTAGLKSARIALKNATYVGNAIKPFAMYATMVIVIMVINRTWRLL